jgi:DNA-binding PadR family transcriptional regulator
MVDEAVTQLGIASAVEINYSHVPRAVKRLQDDGLIIESLAHITNQPTARRRKAYFLTEDGFSVARELHGEIAKRIVKYKDKDGKTIEIPMEKIPDHLGSIVDIIKIYNHLTFGDVFDRALWDRRLVENRRQKLKEEKSLITTKEKAKETLSDHGLTIIQGDDQGILLDSKQFPYNPSILNREKQLASLQKAIKSNGVRLIILTGDYGIGKSTLIANAVHNIAGGNENIIWCNISKLNSVEQIIGYLYQLFFNSDISKSLIGNIDSIEYALNEESRELEYNREQMEKPIIDIFQKLSTQSSILVLDGLEISASNAEAAIQNAISAVHGPDIEKIQSIPIFESFLTHLFDILESYLNVKIVVATNRKIQNDTLSKISTRTKTNKNECVIIHLNELDLRNVKKMLGSGFNHSDVEAIFHHVGGNPLLIKTIGEIYESKRSELSSLEVDERALSLILQAEKIISKSQESRAASNTN